ncbi:MAG TPA: type II secretion system F family protein [Hyphomonas sp.]|nr:type II secretion system F family protein [Hyphomonas sp.]HRK67971.1 type II secretion system F family protein [Hyphomonas sp.]
MVRFRYRAFLADGRVVSDVVSAGSESDAVRELMTQGLTPFEISDAAAAGASVAGRGGKQTPRVLAGFCRNLSSMLAGGLPLDEALKLLADDPEDKNGARLAANLRSGVLSGQSLADAMASLKAPPPDYVIGLVRAGEEGGSTVPVLNRLAVSIENEMRLTEAIRGALIYPVILLVTSLISIGVILLVVAPALEPVLAASSAGTPASAELLMAASRWLRECWPVLLIAPLVIWLLAMSWSRTGGGKRWLSGFALKLPVIGPLVRDMESARCLASLSALLENGVSLVPAMEIAGQGARNPLVKDALDRVADEVRIGVRLSDAIAGDGFLPMVAAQLAAVGERSADMAGQLGQAASVLETRSQRRISTLTTLAAPVMTLLLGVLIGGIVLTLLSAIMSVNDLAI